MLELKIFKTTLALVASFITTVSLASYSGIGTQTSASELVDWDISVFFDGENLPKGSGNLEDGEEIYASRCAMCHGDFGEGANKYPKLLGSEVEDLITAAQEAENNVMMRGVNNYWGHAPTLFDMIKRAMPYFAPQSLSNDQTYSVTGYVLVLAEIIDDDVEVIDADFLRSIEMPGRDLFITDNRPDTKNVRCMENCFEGALIKQINRSATDEERLASGAYDPEE